MARKVRNIQSQRGPETDHRGQAWNKHRPELSLLGAARNERARGRQHDAEPARLAAAGQEGIIETEDYRGEPVLAAYRYIQVSPDFGWGMVVKRDKAEIFAPLRRKMFQSAFTMIISILGFAFLTVGLVLAAVWSANERETFQIWQSQREILALASWVIFGVVLYARLVSGWRGRKMALLSIAGFIAVMLRIIGGPFL